MKFIESVLKDWSGPKEISGCLCKQLLDFGQTAPLRLQSCDQCCFYVKYQPLIICDFCVYTYIVLKIFPHSEIYSLHNQYSDGMIADFSCALSLCFVLYCGTLVFAEATVCI